MRTYALLPASHTLGCTSWHQASGLLLPATCVAGRCRPSWLLTLPSSAAALPAACARHRLTRKPTHPCLPPPPPSIHTLSHLAHVPLPRLSSSNGSLPGGPRRLLRRPCPLRLLPIVVLLSPRAPLIVVIVTVGGGRRPGRVPGGPDRALALALLLPAPPGLASHDLAGERRRGAGLGLPSTVTLQSRAGRRRAAAARKKP